MLYLTIIGGAFIAWLIVATLFTPHIPYHIEADVDARGEHFIHVLESTCQTRLEPGNRVEILTDGEAFYAAMLAAIRGARETVNMECYIFKQGEIGEAAAGRRLPCRRVPTVHLVSTRPPEQPHAPRAAGDRRNRRVRRGRGRRRLVGEADAGQAEVARHDGANRRAGRL